MAIAWISLIARSRAYDQAHPQHAEPLPWLLVEHPNLHTCTIEPFCIHSFTIHNSQSLCLIKAQLPLSSVASLDLTFNLDLTFGC